MVLDDKPVYSPQITRGQEVNPKIRDEDEKDHQVPRIASG